MARKRRKKKRSSFLQQGIMLAIIGSIAYFFGLHNEEVKQVYNDKAPAVESFIKDKAPTIKDATSDGLKNIGKMTQSGVDKIKGIINKENTDNGISIPNADQQLAVAEKLRICSFNIRIFSNNSRDDEELNHIVDILQSYDLIAIQELKDETVLKRTVRKLEQRNQNFDYIISDAVGRGVKERYAFLYRPELVSVTRDGELYEDQYDEFIREPYYASFKSGNFDFTLVTFHALFGDSKSDRRPEIIRLAHVYDFVKQNQPQEQDIILLGDFNFSPNDDGFNHLRSFPGMTALIQKGKTTITDTSLYDNFWFQTQYVNEFTGRYGIDKFDEHMFDNNDRDAKLAVSDHRPIWAEFQISSVDDD